ncbi:MAG: hypothetical protein IJU56_10415 [Clostridia bacterium]|nr:hypothetical protein [Clostridia bacterium]
MKREEEKKRPMHPERVILLSFLGVITVGTLLFMLPVMTRKEPLRFMEALFTATSSVCVTGLTLIDPAATLSAPGQILLMVLIEIGGISMVTFATFFIFALKKRSGFRSIRLAQEYTNLDLFSQVKPLVRTIIITTVLCQALGAGVLCLHFVPRFGLKGVWMSAFTAVSAYCNAGFDIFGANAPFTSMTGFNGEPLVMGAVMALIVTGGLGFYVFYDLLTYRKNHHITLHTKTVAVFTLALILFGFCAVLGFEWTNPKTLAPMPLSQKLTAALFQSVTARTAGFASVNIGEMQDVTKLFMLILMFIGAGSGSTGGGIKVTTFAVLVMTVVSVLRGHEDTVIFGRRVEHKTVAKSLSVAALGLLAVLIVSSVIVLETPGMRGIDVLFEAVSAFSTAGLSTGVTASCGVKGLLSLILAMFFGRVGPVCFIIALGNRDSKADGRVLPEGRIMVG